MSKAEEQPGPSKPTESTEEKDKEDRTFECNICLDTAKDAVVSMCGHLFWFVLIHNDICNKNFLNIM